MDLTGDWRRQKEQESARHEVHMVSQSTEISMSMVYTSISRPNDWHLHSTVVRQNHFGCSTQFCFFVYFGSSESVLTKHELVQTLTIIHNLLQQVVLSTVVELCNSNIQKPHFEEYLPFSSYRDCKLT